MFHCIQNFCIQRKITHPFKSIHMVHLLCNANFNSLSLFHLQSPNFPRFYLCIQFFLSFFILGGHTTDQSDECEITDYHPECNHSCKSLHINHQTRAFQTVFSSRILPNCFRCHQTQNP